MPGSFASLSRFSTGSIPLAVPIDEGIPLDNVGRRSAPRLRLSIPATIITISETRKCIMLDVSRGGAQIGLEQPLSEGAAGFLRFADLEVFGVVIRRGTGLNGIEFEYPITDVDVLSVRHFAEAYEADMRGTLRAQAKAWVMGDA